MNSGNFPKENAGKRPPRQPKAGAGPPGCLGGKRSKPLLGLELRRSSSNREVDVAPMCR